jgi:hypothetical protein
MGSQPSVAERRPVAGRRPSGPAGLILDEEIDIALAECLQPLGLAAIHTTQVLGRGATDEAVFWLARSSGWPLVLVADAGEAAPAGLLAAGVAAFVLPPSLVRQRVDAAVALIRHWSTIGRLMAVYEPPFVFVYSQSTDSWRRLHTGSGEA